MKSVPGPTRTPPSGRRGHRPNRLSPDGRWKSFPRVPHLLQYVSTGMYYARVRVRSKLVRRALNTRVYSDALLRLGDFLKEQRTAPPRPDTAPVTFQEARLLFEQDLEARHDLRERAREYRQGCIKVLLKTWSGLDSLKLKRITATACQEWARKFLEKGYDDHYFNQTLSTLRHILDRAALHPNPAAGVKRRGVRLKELKLPEPDQFERLLQNMEQAGGRHSRYAADLVRFLAFSGCQLSEARKVTWEDVDLKRGRLLVENAKQRLTSLGSAKRQVPIIPDMRRLLERLQQTTPSPDEPVCRVHECQKSLRRACEELGLARLTHHDLRHYSERRIIPSAACRSGDCLGRVVRAVFWTRNNQSIPLFMFGIQLNGKDTYDQSLLFRWQGRRPFAARSLGTLSRWRGRWSLQSRLRDSNGPGENPLSV